MVMDDCKKKSTITLTLSGFADSDIDGDYESGAGERDRRNLNHVPDNGFTLSRNGDVNGIFWEIKNEVQSKVKHVSQMP